MIVSLRPCTTEFRFMIFLFWILMSKDIFKKCLMRNFPWRRSFMLDRSHSIRNRRRMNIWSFWSLNVGIWWVIDGKIEWLIIGNRPRLIFFSLFDLSWPNLKFWLPFFILFKRRRFILCLVLVSWSLTKHRIENFLKFVHAAFFFIEVNIYVYIKVICCIIHKCVCTAIRVALYFIYLFDFFCDLFKWTIFFYKTGFYWSFFGAFNKRFI